MIHITVLTHKDVPLTALSSTLALLHSANAAMNKKGNKPVFEVETVGLDSAKMQIGDSIQLKCVKTIYDHFDTDVVIIPPIVSNADETQSLLNKNKMLIGWLGQKYKEKVQMISLCTGAYLLAESGLLNGKPATSHWGAMEDLQQRFPLVQFKPDHVVTSSKQVITGGGGFSSLNAILFFIEKHCGKEIAINISKHYALDYGRNSQSCFTIFSGQRLHNDNDIHLAQAFIEKNYSNEISVEGIARHVNMSKRNFIRRFKAATSMNPIEFIQRIKIEAAKKAIEKGGNKITTVIYDVGYNDPKTFRKAFKKITGVTPVEYRKRYNVGNRQ